jgi:MFS superfamily sulfate permease-like transporter
MLSAKAVDLIDPKKRKTNLDRDVLAVGLANTCAALVGGLPMISEIVRSRANIDNGARSRWSDAFHSVCLLLCVLLASDFLHHIPMAALGAMLVYTGFRLGGPREFISAWKTGWEQFIIFTTTVVVTLAVDLLVGIASGILMKFLLHLFNGVPITALFKAPVEITQADDKTVLIRVRKALVFSNWLSMKGKLLAQPKDVNVILDLSETRFVDHSVMEKLHEMSHDFEASGRQLKVIGLESHKPLSKHPLAARAKKLVREAEAPVSAVGR